MSPGCPPNSAADSVIFRYKSLVGMSELPAANGENCVSLLRKLCPLSPGSYHVGVTKVKFWHVHLFWGKGLNADFSRNLFVLHMQKRQLFLKEDIYQMLEYKRERMRHLAALTLQRYARMFFVRKRYLAFRKKIIWLQAQCRGFLTRLDCSVPNWTYVFAKMRLIMVFPLIPPFN